VFPPHSFRCRLQLRCRHLWRHCITGLQTTSFNKDDNPDRIVVTAADKDCRVITAANNNATKDAKGRHDVDLKIDLILPSVEPGLRVEPVFAIPVGLSVGL